MKTQKTTMVHKPSRAWQEIDASKASLGRIATQIAIWLRGKHKRGFTPTVDGGDFVVATHVSFLRFTGRKLEQKTYYRHSGYLGGLKQTSLKTALANKPEWVLRKAVREMLDDVKFRKAMLARLKIVLEGEHNYPTKKS